MDRLLANAALLAGSLPAVRGLRRALRDPYRAQAAILERFLAANAGCAYGKAHGLGRVRSPRDFQDAVPVASYDDLEPWIERAMAGEAGVLTKEPVLLFETTSGSTGAVKHIPYTASLQAEFRRAVGAWLGELALERPGSMLGPSYWAVTPLARPPSRTAGGIPVGFASDAEVLGGWVGRLLERRLAVPSSVARSRDLETALYETARHLLAARDLSFISVWNPSFLTLLLDRVHEHREALASGELLALISRRAWSEVWPRMAVLSCWADAAAKDAVPAAREAFPLAFLQPKGLLATEGVVTIPLSSYGGCVPALESHLLEFRPWDGEPAAGRPLLAHELEPGREYDVLLTTGGGMWRYELGDVVRVRDRRGAVPVLEFVGRGGAVCDLRGEKLSAAFVGPVLRGLAEAGLWRGGFALLAPVAGPAYCLFVEGRVRPGLDAALDAALRSNPHYDYCRRLGQLGPAGVFLVRGGAHEAYLARCRRAGARAGAVKPPVLDAGGGWERVFEGSFLSEEAAA